MDVKHRPGVKYINADSLSRLPDQSPCAHLPCGGCTYCTRASEKWADFKEDVDYAVPLSQVAEPRADLNRAMEVSALGEGPVRGASVAEQ